MQVAPSILAADQLHLEREVSRMVEAGCDLLHVDVMDGHFVPNMSFGPGMVLALHARFPELRLDVHLMLDNPANYLQVFAKAGAWGITVHAEIPGGAESCLREIRALGCSAGLALKPATQAAAVTGLFPLTDMMLVMTVEPGFGGQHFNSAMLQKLAHLRALGWEGLIEADGGLQLSNLPLMAAHGLDVAVMGTAMFGSDDPARDIAKIHGM